MALKLLLLLMLVCSPAYASDFSQPSTSDHGELTGLTDDDHTQYRLESADHTHQSTGLQGGTLDHGLAITGLTDDDHTQYVEKDGSDAPDFTGPVSIDIPSDSIALSVVEHTTQTECSFVTYDDDGTTILLCGKNGRLGGFEGISPTQIDSDEVLLRNNGSSVRFHQSGTGDGSTVILGTAATNGVVKIQPDDSTDVFSATKTSVDFPIGLTSSGTSSFGWTVVAGADTACNTTCVSACVVGFAADVTGSNPVACSSATADSCLCAGSS